MANIEHNALGAVGEHQTLSRLLLLGYDAALTNLSVANNKTTDILCRDPKGRFAAIQVKTTSADSFNTGISHKEFYDENGQIDLAKGKSYLEKNIVGPWVFVQIGGSPVYPTFKFFVLSRSKVIDIIFSNEKWYLTGFNRTNPLKGSGQIYLYAVWFLGHNIPVNSNHIEWVNPFANTELKFEDAWHNLWVD